MEGEHECETYWFAVGLLQEVINSGFRGSKEDILEELENDLEEG